MARIEQVIHVKYDGEVRECALFDSASDIPSPATAREFGLNGAKIYGAVLDGGDTSDDGEWVRDNNGTELAFHDGSSSLRLLTTPYFVRPKTETLEFGADGGTVYLEDYSSRTETIEGILSTNGTYAGYSCDYDGISVVNEGNARIPQWAVVCAENTSSEDIAFTLTLTFSFDDGSTQDITFTGTQAAAGEKETWLTVTPSEVSIAAAGGSATLEVDSSSDWTAATDVSWVSVTPSSGGGGGISSVKVTALYWDRDDTYIPNHANVTFTNSEGTVATARIYLEY